MRSRALNVVKMNASPSTVRSFTIGGRFKKSVTILSLRKSRSVSNCDPLWRFFFTLYAQCTTLLL